MPRFLHTVLVCGTGERARAALSALTDTGTHVKAFIALPWEPAHTEFLGYPVLQPHDLTNSTNPCVLMTSERPRKARKLLQQHAPDLPVLDSFAEFLRFMQQGLSMQHPILFPDRPDPDSRRMFEYDRGLLPNKLLALMEDGVDHPEKAFRHSGLSIGYPGWNLLYYCCLCSLRPGIFNLVLETGSNVGCSTIILAQAIKDSGYHGLVLSADVDEELLQQANYNLELAGLDHLARCVEQDGVDFLRNRGNMQVSADQTIPFVFLDDCHEARHVFREFEALHPWLDAHSVVFFDNVDDPEGVAGALDMISKNFGGNIVRFENTSWNPPGQALWQAQGLQGIVA